MTFELIYTSIPATEAPDIRAILESARRRNSENEVTGLLCFDGKRFLQILEGDKKAVEDIYASIVKDPRHKNVDLLHSAVAVSRNFSSWAMAYDDTPGNILSQLNENMGVTSLKAAKQKISEMEQSLGARLFGLFFRASFQ